MASERAAEKKELETRNTALESEVSRLSGEVKVAAQNARATSGQVRERDDEQGPDLRVPAACILVGMGLFIFSEIPVLTGYVSWDLELS